MGYEAYVILGNITYLIIFLIGMCLGSFLNSWIWRAHENIRISRGRSICPACHRQLQWYENIPIMSCIVLRGRCRTCSHPIPKHFIFVEIIAASLFLYVTWYEVNFLAFNYYVYLRNIIFVGILLVIFIYDYLYKEIIPGLIWMGVVAAIFFHLLNDSLSVSSMLVGALIGGGFFLAQYLFSKGRWIGGGDVRLGIMMGVWLGWQITILALMLAYVIGAIFGVILLITKRKSMQSEIPFGTFLAIATFICLYHGNTIMMWYLNLLH